MQQQINKKYKSNARAWYLPGYHNSAYEAFFGQKTAKADGDAGCTLKRISTYLVTTGFLNCPFSITVKRLLFLSLLPSLFCFIFGLVCYFFGFRFVFSFAFYFDCPPSLSKCTAHLSALPSASSICSPIEY